MDGSGARALPWGSNTTPGVHHPCQGNPNRDAVRLWTALGPGLCGAAATRHPVCTTLARVPPTVTPCGCGRLWGSGSAVWQKNDTTCAPTLAWTPPPVTPCGYGRLWGPGSAVWQQTNARCALWRSGKKRRWASMVAKPRVCCLAVDGRTAKLGRREPDHRQLRWPA